MQWKPHLPIQVFSLEFNEKDERDSAAKTTKENIQINSTDVEWDRFRFTRVLSWISPIWK